MTSEPDPWPSVSVIVPVYGDRGDLVRTTRALAAQDYPGSFEVVIADNGDNVDLDAAAGCLNDVRVVNEERPGSYAARNAALVVAKGEVLAFTDADCLPRQDWLRAGVARLRQLDGPGFVGGAISLFAASPSRPTNAELWDCVHGLRQDRYVQGQGWAATANMFTSRTTIDLVGAFDERLMSGGDREWGERASRLGATGVYEGRAVVDHPARHTMGELHRKIRRVTRGQVDARRAAGQPALDASWAVMLRPHTRSIVRRSVSVSERWTVTRLRYVAVSHWVQYSFALANARAVRGGRRQR